MTSEERVPCELEEWERVLLSLWTEGSVNVLHVRHHAQAGAVIGGLGAEGRTLPAGKEQGIAHSPSSSRFALFCLPILLAASSAMI